MKLTKASLVSAVMLAAATCFAPLAHAGLIGDSATLTFNQRGFSNPLTFASPQVVGAGTEFSATAQDVFGQIWTVNGDVSNNGFNLSWTESTRANNTGNISAGTDAFGFDLSFASSVLPDLTLVSSVGSSATASRVVIRSTGANSVHFGFDHMYSGESYTFANVPEPGTTALMFAGLGLLGVTARRKSKKS